VLKARIFSQNFIKHFHNSRLYRYIRRKFHDDLPVDVILLEEFFVHYLGVHFVRVPLIFIYARKK